MADIVERLTKIADASRRTDGSDIPLGADCRSAADEIKRLRADLDLLQDPAAVHLNMLRGGIAMPSLANIKHLYPEVREMAEQVERLTPQPIETAPKDGRRILIFDPRQKWTEGWWKISNPTDMAWWENDAESEPAPTHWMPIPSTEGKDA